MTARFWRILAAALLVSVAFPGRLGDDVHPCGPRLGELGADGRPADCWRPYGQRSPFNAELPPRPRLHPRSDELVRRLTAFGPPQRLEVGLGRELDFWHPVYFSRPGDPEFTLRCRKPWGRCEIEGHRVRIPEAARPAGGDDAHLTVVDPASGWEYDLWQVRSKPDGGGELTFSWGGRTRIDGDGLGSQSTAAAFGGLAGIVRAAEARSGDIPHALFMIALCTSERPVAPAGGDGARCRGRRGPPMGARFMLDMTPEEIAAVPGPPLKRALLTAMARYGMYLGDTGGDSWGVQLESSAAYTSLGAPDPFSALAKAQGLARHGEGWALHLAPGVDWESRLRVVHPCVAARRCG